MLYITDKQNKIIWYVGTVFPVLTGNVITFQADGHELEVILDALKRASHKSDPKET